MPPISFNFLSWLAAVC